MTLAVVASLGTEKKSQILNVKFYIDLENFMHFKLDTPMYQDTFSTSERNVSYSGTMIPTLSIMHIDISHRV